MYSSSRASAVGLRSDLDFYSPDEALELQKQLECLMPRLRLAVIFGGNKLNPSSVVYQSGNSRSWKSYEAVAQNIADSLSRIGFRHVELMPDDMHLGDRIRRAGIHMAWLNTGGVQGYNSTAHAPAMLEMFGVPYVGHDPLIVSTLDNKHAFKREARCAGLPTAPFSTWNMARGPFRPDRNSRFRAAFGDYAGPFIVKPVSGRASLHVHLAENQAALPGLVEQVYRATENVVLIEKYLAGREFCIAAAGPVTARGGRLARRGEPFTFAALERVLSDDEAIFTSMDVRPITNDRLRPVDGRREPDLLNRLHRIARDTFLEFDLGSLVRLDLRSDATGELYILEANPKPDLKAPSQGVTSLISAGLAESGMDYDDLIFSLIADRVDFLLTHRGGSVGHIVELLNSTRSDTTQLPSPQAIIDRSLMALTATLEATRAGARKGFAVAAAEVQSLGQQVEKLAGGSDRAGDGKKSGGR
jgi:D-alanine-D-alanine ligase